MHKFIRIISSFTFLTLLSNVAFPNKVVFKAFLFLLIIYGTRIVYNPNFRTNIKNIYGINDSVLDTGHFFSHYIAPLNLLYFWSMNTIFIPYIFIEGLIMGLFYSSVINVEKVYFIRKEVIVRECIAIWVFIFVAFNWLYF
jgi:hypothetical protein